MQLISKAFMSPPVSISKHLSLFLVWANIGCFKMEIPEGTCIYPCSANE